MIAHADEASAAGAIELRRMQDGRLQSEMIPMRDVVTRDNAAAQAEARLLPAGTTEAERRALRILIDAFVTENAFFDADATGSVASARGRSHPGDGEARARRGDRPPGRARHGFGRGKDPRPRRTTRGPWT